MSNPPLDPRQTPANGRFAAESLRGQVTSERFTAGEPARVAVAITDLYRTPNGALDRQLTMGAGATIYEQRDGWAYIQAEADGFCGYVAANALRADHPVSHFVAVVATRLYDAPDPTAKAQTHLSFGAKLNVTNELRSYWETPLGFIPKRHLWPLEKTFSSPATAAQLHFGVPYLWGGNSTLGIDCSGLVQAALLASGIPCPRDSDQQEAALGLPLPPDAAPKRGDLWFWKGHVAMLVDEHTLIHANGHHMTTAYEPAKAAAIRIEAQGEGPVTSKRRLA